MPDHREWESRRRKELEHIVSAQRSQVSKLDMEHAERELEFYRELDTSLKPQGLDAKSPDEARYEKPEGAQPDKAKLSFTETRENGR